MWTARKERNGWAENKWLSSINVMRQTFSLHLRKKPKTTAPSLAVFKTGLDGALSNLV